jgi:hypothetical protein
LKNQAYFAHFAHFDVASNGKKLTAITRRKYFPAKWFVQRPCSLI